MEWNDLQIFLAIARHKTLSAAAKELKQTQPTIGRRLKTLEKSVGQKLFYLTKTGYALTDEGLSALALAEAAEENALGFQKILQGRSPSGTLTISTFDWFGIYALPQIIKPYSEQFPQVESVIMTDNKVISLSKREADIAIRLTPFDEANVVQISLMKVPYSLYGHRKLPLLELPQRDAIPLIAMNTMYQDVSDMRWLRSTLPSAHIVARSNNRQAQAELCNLGIGYAVLPEPIAQKYPQLRKQTLGTKIPSKDIFLGYHRDQAKLERVKGFIQIAKDVFKT